MSLYSQIFVDDFARSHPPALAAGLSTRRAPRTLRGVRAFDPMGHGVVARRGRFAGESAADTSGLDLPQRSYGKRARNGPVSYQPLSAYPGPAPMPTDLPAPAGAPPADAPSEGPPTPPSPSSAGGSGSVAGSNGASSVADKMDVDVPPATAPVAERRDSVASRTWSETSLAKDPFSSLVERLRVQQNTAKARPQPPSLALPPVISPPLVARPDVSSGARLQTPNAFPTVAPPVTGGWGRPLDLFPAPGTTADAQTDGGGKAVSSWKQTAKGHLRTLADEGKTALREVGDEAMNTVRSRFQETKAQLKADAQAAVHGEIDVLAGKAGALKDRAQAAVSKKAGELKGKALAKTEEWAGKAKTAVTSKAREYGGKAKTAVKAQASALGTKAKTAAQTKAKEAGSWLKKQGTRLGKQALAGAKDFVNTAWPTGGGGTKAVKGSSAAPVAVKVPPARRPSAAVAPGPAKKVPNYVPVSVPKPNLRTGAVSKTRGRPRKVQIAVAAA
jgi:hypothetical protein